MSNDKFVSGINFSDRCNRHNEELEFASISRQLKEYFAGTRVKFELNPQAGGTLFQKKVWGAILAIPYGQTRTYSEIAANIGMPSAVRAVGAACGKNPLLIVIPCHRVVGSEGKLTGYAGGIERKKWLLGHESNVLRRNGFLESKATKS